MPRAERAAEEDSRKRVAQEMSRLQSTLEYLLLKGDLVVAQHEIAVLAHNHDIIVAVLTDDRDVVIAATRRAWLGRPVADVLPKFDFDQAAGAIRERRARVTIDADGNALLGYAGILMGREARASCARRAAAACSWPTTSTRPKAEARAQVIQQSLYWAGLGDRAGAGDVAGVPLPADAPHRAPGARRRATRRRRPRPRAAV